MRAIRSTLLLTTLVLISLAATCTLQAQPPTLESRVQRLVADHKGKAAVAIKDLTTGETLALQGDEPMPTASLIKVAVMVEAYRQAEAGAVDLDEPVVLDEDDKVQGSGILTTHFSAGTRMVMLLSLRRTR